MKYLEFIKNIKLCDEKNNISVVYEEKYLLDDVILRLKDRYVNDENFDYLEIDANDVQEMELVDFCNGFSLFSDRKLLVINNSEKLSLNKDVLNLMLNSSVCVIFIFEEKKGSYKKISKDSIILEISKLDENILTKWINKKFNDNKKKIRNTDINYLIKISTYLEYKSVYSLYDFVSDINKISSVENDVITKEIIDSVMTRPFEDNVYIIQDAISTRDLKYALKVFYDLNENGVNLHSIPPILSRFFKQLSEVKILNNKSINRFKISEIIGVKSDYIVRKIIKQSYNYSDEELIKKLGYCLEIENKTKSIKVNLFEEIEMLIVNLCK